MGVRQLLRPVAGLGSPLPGPLAVWGRVSPYGDPQDGPWRPVIRYRVPTATAAIVLDPPTNNYTINRVMAYLKPTTTGHTLFAMNNKVTGYSRNLSNPTGATTYSLSSSLNDTSVTVTSAAMTSGYPQALTIYIYTNGLTIAGISGQMAGDKSAAGVEADWSLFGGVIAGSITSLTRLTFTCSTGNWDAGSIVIVDGLDQR